MKFKFGTNDFNNLGLTEIDKSLVSEAANVKIQEWFKEAKVVYSDKGPYFWTEDGGKESSKYKALLINIEPIEKCKHPETKIQYGYQDLIFCECGVQLKIKVTYEEIK